MRDSFKIVAARLTCFYLISAIETDLREQLRDLLRVCPEQFRFPSDVRESALARLIHDLDDSTHDWNSAVSDPDYLPYLDFADISKLIHANKNLWQPNCKQQLLEVARLIESAVGPRNRVCHSRPLEDEDLPDILNLVDQLLSINDFELPSLSNAHASLRSNPSSPLELSIPEFWLADLDDEIPHNLPIPEFDDTGFLGRHDDRGAVIRHIRGPHPVISITGSGGVGKTALALRCLYDVLDTRGAMGFDAIVWVSMKDRSLTSAGVREITGVPGTEAEICKRIGKTLEKALGFAGQPEDIEALYKSLEGRKCIIALDNCETLNSATLEKFILSIPSGTKMLITSRKTVVASVPYPLGALDDSSAIKLMRAYARVLNIEELYAAPQRTLKSYCASLHSNPLAVKWFVASLATGRRADALLRKDGEPYTDVLRFAFENLYSELTSLEEHITKLMTVTRKPLSHAEIYLLSEKFIEDGSSLEFALSRLYQLSVLSRRRIDAPGSTTTYEYVIGELASEYIKYCRSIPPDFTEAVRAKLQSVRARTDYARTLRENYKFNRYVPHPSTPEEVVVSSELQLALKESRRQNFDKAFELVERAGQMKAGFAEVYRIHGEILKRKGLIYEAEVKMEYAIELSPNSPISRFSLAMLLLHDHEDYDRALEYLEGLVSDYPNDNAILSAKAWCLTRIGRYKSAIEIYERLVGDDCDDAQASHRRSHIAQYVECLRRWGNHCDETADAQGRNSCFESACALLQKAIDGSLWDTSVTDGAVHLMKSVVIAALKESSEQLALRAAKIMSLLVRVQHQFSYQDLQLIGDLAGKFPDVSGLRVNMEDVSTTRTGDRREVVEIDGEEFSNVGVVDSLALMKNFGFILTPSGERVFFHKGSLRNPELWTKLRKGSSVGFSIGENEKGAMAVDLAVTAF